MKRLLLLMTLSLSAMIPAPGSLNLAHDLVLKECAGCIAARAIDTAHFTTRHLGASSGTMTYQDLIEYGKLRYQSKVFCYYCRAAYDQVVQK